MQRISLDQKTIELYAIGRLAQGRDLAASIGGVGALGDRHAQAVGIQAHLSAGWPRGTSSRGSHRSIRDTPAKTA